MIAPTYFQELANSQNLQLIIDRSQLVLQQQSVWRQYLTEAPAQVSLTFDAAIGRERIAAAASIVDMDAPAPLRSRPTLERYTGTIPSIKERFRMSQKDMRDIEVLRALPIVSGGGSDAIISFLVKDLQEASVSGDKRVDIMLMQALSTLHIDVNTTNNPDGAAYGDLDLLAASYQKQGVPTIWSDTANADPITDIQNFVDINQKTRGRSFSKILMPYEVWVNFRNTAKVKATLTAQFTVGLGATDYKVTLGRVNEVLVDLQLPIIEVVNYYVNVETDGKLTIYKPWNINNVTFVPGQIVGNLLNALPMERLKPIPNVNYANFGPTLVKKFLEMQPYAETTEMEMNAFPALDIDSIYILTTNVVQASFN